jgi:hypothetical protein
MYYLQLKPKSYEWILIDSNFEHPGIKPYGVED